MSEPTIPVAREQAEISKRVRTTGTVTVETHVREDRQAVEARLARETVEVRRVKVDRFVDGPVPDRQDGDTLIVSVLEEVPVVERRLKVVEEIHLVRRRSTETVREDIPLRREEVTVTRGPAPGEG